MASKSQLRRESKAALEALCVAKGLPVCRDLTKADLVDMLADREYQDAVRAQVQQDLAERAAFEARYAAEPMEYKVVVRCGAEVLHTAAGATREEATKKAEAWLSFARAASRGALVGAWVDCGIVGLLAA